MRHEFTYPGAGVAMLRELEQRRRDGKTGLRRSHAGQTLTAANGIRQFRFREILETRLVIEQLHLRWAAGLKQVNHPLGLGCQMRDLLA